MNETEYSLFNREEYEKFKANPEVSVGFGGLRDVVPTGLKLGCLLLGIDRSSGTD